MIDPGRGELTSLTRDVRRGLMIYDVIGMWLSNPINGFLNATVTNGVLIEDGVEKYPVKGVIISGNIYELLKRDEISLTSDTENHGTYILPHMYLPEISIAGS